MCVIELNPYFTHGTSSIFRCSFSSFRCQLTIWDHHLLNSFSKTSGFQLHTSNSRVMQQKTCLPSFFHRIFHAPICWIIHSKHSYLQHPSRLLPEYLVFNLMTDSIVLHCQWNLQGSNDKHSPSLLLSLSIKNPFLLVRNLICLSCTGILYLIKIQPSPLSPLLTIPLTAPSLSSIHLLHLHLTTLSPLA